MTFRLILTTAAFGMLSASCMKSPSFAVDKGPDVPCSAIDQAVATIQQPNIENIKNSEFANVDSYTTIDSPFKELTEQVATTVTSRTETATEIDLVINEETNEKVNGVFKKSDKEGPAVIEKDGGNASSSSSSAVSSVAAAGPVTASDFQKSLGVSAAAANQGAFCQAQTQGLVSTYNNLTISSDTMPLPEAVTNRTDCGGLKSCAAVNVQKLQFDRWVPDPNNPGQELKVTTYITTSSDVPFFASVLSSCMQYSWPYYDNGATSGTPSRYVLVTACDDVTDFTFGK